MFSQSYLFFSLSGSLALWHVCTLDSVYLWPLSLSLPHTYLLLWLLFSILLGSPSTLSPYLFSPFFPLLYPPLSPAPLLSPSERLRIPKGADAIKMLILSVYREREKEGGGWQHEGLRLTWRTRLKWRTGGWGVGGTGGGVCVWGGGCAEREGGGDVCWGDGVKKGMLAREKTDKDKACAVSWAMIYWLRLSLIYAYVWKALQLMYSTILLVRLFTLTCSTSYIVLSAQHTISTLAVQKWEWLCMQWKPSWIPWIFHSMCCSLRLSIPHRPAWLVTCA